jgi:hypothetical protein
MDHPTPALVTLDGHRLSSLYRGIDPKSESSWLKYSGERERQRLSLVRSGAERHSRTPPAALIVDHRTA